MDLTVRRNAERGLKMAREQAELYVDVMGHDINNLNQIALGYLELAGRDRRHRRGRQDVHG